MCPRDGRGAPDRAVTPVGQHWTRPGGCMARLVLFRIDSFIDVTDGTRAVGSFGQPPKN